MTTLEILRNSRALIADEKDWWDGGPNAGDRHCVLTAITAISGGLHGEAWRRGLAARNELAPDGCLSLMNFNDTHRHAEVLELFDHAIARLEEQETQEQPCPTSDTSTSSRLSPVPA